MKTNVLPAHATGALDTAARCLRGGGLAALPTETVYGLAADATNGEAVARVFEAKGRPSFNPLIAHVCDLDMAGTIARFEKAAERLAERFWPGPLTLVLDSAAGSSVHPLVRAGLPTVAVRMPRGPVADVARRLGRPIAAPSANRSGRVSATSAAHVADGLSGRIDLILDGGPCELGLESTILKPVGDRLVLLRPGALTAEEIEDATGLALSMPEDGIQAPGQMQSHYAPHARLRLNAQFAEPGEHFIAFGPVDPSSTRNAASLSKLSETSDLREAASRLFEVLAALDDPAIERIAVAPVPMAGLGIAINDRLARAAAPR